MNIMDVLSTFAQAMLVGAFAENVLLRRGWDASNIMWTSRHRDKGPIWYGLILTSITTIATLPAFVASSFIRNLEYRYIIIPILYIACIVATYLAAVILVQEFLPIIAKKVVRRMPVSVFNCAVLSVLVSQIQTRSLAQAIGYGFGVGVGYTLVMFLVSEGYRRLMLCDLPKPFKGMPVLLIYVGLLSLAFAGLTQG